MEQDNVNISREKYNVSKLEECCYKLRDAIIDLSLKFPEFDTFENYIYELKDYSSFFYISRLLHRCWCLAHPDYLFNTMQGTISGIDDLKKLRMMGNKSKRALPNVLMNKPVNPMEMEYYNKYMAYKDGQHVTKISYFVYYMDKLFDIFKSACDEVGINISQGFIIEECLHTSATPAQLEKAFDVFSTKYGCCDNSSENRQTFLSMFDCTTTLPEGTISWKNIGSANNKEFFIGSIYAVFKAVGVDMNITNKRIICDHILVKNVKIDPEKLKNRKENDLQQTLISAIESAMKSI